MLLFKKVEDLQAHLHKIHSKGKTIGLAPTMGALHQGHLSLIRQCKQRKDYSVCSIFVNPTQFNETADLEKYPRTIERDIELLTSVGNDVLFMPSVKEVYPPGLQTAVNLDFGSLAKVMEGAHRPGHFEGMAQVVNRLMDIVGPHRIYMGQKDFQQFTIVESMIRQLEKNIELVVCPIIREESGLAMSSRNLRLLAEDREQAPLLHQMLCFAKEQMHSLSPSEIKAQVMEKLSAPASFKPEYFEIADGYTLQAIEDFAQHDYVVACTAVWAGDVRLIDNMILRNVE